MMNIVDIYKRVVRAVEVHRPETIPQDDWVIYEMLTNLELEDGK